MKISPYQRLTWREAEAAFSVRVDRRRGYIALTSDAAMADHGNDLVLCAEGSFTSSCSGCYESEDGHPVGKYDYDPKANCPIGAGCHECGYTGKRRQYFPYPIKINDHYPRITQ